MSTATLEAKLKLDIAGLQANLAKADGEIKGLQDRLRERSRAGAAGVGEIARAHEALAARVARTNELFGARPVNPWTTASAGAAQYAQVLEQKVIPAMQKQGQAAAWQPRTGEGMDSNRLLAQQALRERVAQAAAQRLGRGAGGLANLGMLSMQAQDIAVQLQMGTKASVVLAQQGSQLLSIFGPAGALLGGAVAIGGALFTLGEKGREAFSSMQQEARDFDEQMRAVMAGGLAEAAQGVVDVDTRLRDLHAQMQAMMDSSGMMESLTAWAGGPTLDEKQLELNDQIRAAREMQAKIGERLVEMSGQQLEIDKLRARGDEAKAVALERELALAQQIAKINAMPVAGDHKAALIEDARARATALVETEKLGKARLQILHWDTEIKAMNLRALEPQQRAVALAAEQAKIFEAMHQQGGMFFSKTTQGLEQWVQALRKIGASTTLADALKMQAKALELQKQMDDIAEAQAEKVGAARDRAEAAQAKADFDRLSRTEQIAELQRQIQAAQNTEAFAEEVKAPEAMYEAQLKRIQLQEQLNGLIAEEAQATREAQEKREAAAAEQVQQHERLRDFVSQLQETEARAAGKDKQADQIAKQRRQKAEAEQLARDTGMGYEQALSLVQQLDHAEQKLEERRARGRGQGGQEGERRRIFHTGRVIGMTGMKNWEALQARTDADLLKDGGMGSNRRGGVEALPRKGGAPDVVRLGLIEKATGNVERREQAGKEQRGVEALLRQQNELLKRVMLGTGG